jgi:hypothetical protein
MAPEKPEMEIYSTTVSVLGHEIQVYTPDNWVNASELESATFKLPTLQEIEAIKEHDRIKICNGVERFFVQIEDVHSIDGKIDYLSGIITTELVYDYPYQCGDYVLVYPENIYNIITSEYFDEKTKEYTDRIKNAIENKDPEEINKLTDILKNRTRLVDTDVNEQK